MEKAIGIIGGMGPMATCNLMEKIIRHTDADCDQEHIHIYVDCNTNIPDRTAAILKHGDDPIPEMIKSAHRLQFMGASVLIMPCNTAHYFLPQLKAHVDIPILNMLQETATYLREQGFQTVAVLATDGTIETKLYDKALKQEGITPLYPDPQEQALVMSLIYDCVKAGKACPYPEKVIRMCEHLASQGAQALILGCTELPIAFSAIPVSTKTIDPTEILAKAAVRFLDHTVK